VKSLPSHVGDDSITSSPGQATLSSLLAQDKDLILHTAHDEVGFNKDHCSLCADQGKKSLLSSYFIIFSLLNTYM
jgi:hypothetical protein